MRVCVCVHAVNVCTRLRKTVTAHVRRAFTVYVCVSVVHTLRPANGWWCVCVRIRVCAAATPHSFNTHGPRGSCARGRPHNQNVLERHRACAKPLTHPPTVAALYTNNRQAHASLPDKNVSGIVCQCEMRVCVCTCVRENLEPHLHACGVYRAQSVIEHTSTHRTRTTRRICGYIFGVYVCGCASIPPFGFHVVRRRRRRRCSLDAR